MLGRLGSRRELDGGVEAVKAEAELPFGYAHGRLHSKVAAGRGVFVRRQLGRTILFLDWKRAAQCRMMGGGCSLVPGETPEPDERASQRAKGLMSWTPRMCM